jgi:hypothetical protein
MEIVNGSAFWALILVVVCLMIFAYITKEQIIEITNSVKDWVTPYRWLVLVFEVVTIVTLVPVVMYLYYRTIGVEDASLQNLAAVSGQLSRLTISITFLLFYVTRKKR